MKHPHSLTSVATELMEELATQLAELNDSGNQPVTHAEACLLLVLQKMEVLKAAFFSHQTLSKAAEIDFFKNTKPLLTSQFIYYHEIHALELKKPIGSLKAQRKYFLAAYEKLTDFMASNRAFYIYYRSKATSHDAQYFLRQPHNCIQEQETDLFYTDHGYVTTHDTKVAQILAQESLKKYLEKQLLPDQVPTVEQLPSKNNTNTLQWTASKVALVELVYALHALGVFNNGTSKLKTTMESMETVFQMDLRHYHRIFLEIRARKIERTKFIHNLQVKLIDEMDQREDLRC